VNVSEVMTEAVVTDLADDTLADAAAKMREQQTGSLLIMEGPRLVGIFTERDLLKAVAQGKDPKLTQLKEEMTTEIITIGPDSDLREAAELMASRWIRHLPVTKEGTLIGVLSQRDLAGVFAQSVQERPTGELVRARRLKRIEAGDLD
jgi:CBS domain-containing protein